MNSNWLSPVPYDNATIFEGSHGYPIDMKKFISRSETQIKSYMEV
jgi:hypothetical protein